ncbi:hypothetical protein SBRCBS47491_008697 [Sporothrix bragantina]|uniref:F-box domain-containing protein n=1 Tax=Sporothrix bragantina TaxID=671064 RepID=A0ABP0CNI7_9PEZI
MPQPRSLLDLPTEILGQIFGELCIHCQYGNLHFLGGDALVSLDCDMFEVGREGRAALANVSQTCKTLAIIAQPILFHFYHTGNQPRIQDTGVWDDIGYEPGRAEDDMLLPLIRTLLDRPDLAQNFRALALYRSRPMRAAVDNDPRTMARIRAMILQELVIERCNHEYDNEVGPEGMERWLFDVVLGLTPNN